MSILLQNKLNRIQNGLESIKHSLHLPDSTTIEEVANSATTNLNIYVQPTEPVRKEGLWIQKERPANLYFKHQDVTAQGAMIKTQLNDMLYDVTAQGGAVTVGDYAYIFGGANQTNVSYFVSKYNYKTGEFTKLGNIPVMFYAEPLCALGTDIYLLCGIGGASDANKLYKFDTITETWTQCASRPRPNTGSFIEAGSDGKLYSGGCDWSSTQGQNFYCYDPATNRWTEVARPPMSISYSPTWSYKDGIYLFGSNYGSNKKCYRYDITTNQWTLLTTMPANFSADEWLYTQDGKALILGTATTDDKTVQDTTTAIYEYDIENNTFTRLPNLEENVKWIRMACWYDGSLYTFGGAGHPRKSYKWTPPFINTDELNDNTYFLTLTGTKNTFNLYSNDMMLDQLRENSLITVGDVYSFTKETGLVKENNIYYGDGTKWTRG